MKTPHPSRLLQGLGKTVQVAALFGGLHAMGLMQPSLVVCPATVVAHWVRELTTWHPQLRVFTMHAASRTITSGSATPSQIVRAAVAGGAGHVLVTTYEGLRVHRQLLVSQRWGYVVLDEGHRWVPIYLQSSSQPWALELQ